MRADRLLAIIMLLQSRGKMTTEALAKSLEVSRRTILRDVEALSALGIPLYTEGGHGGGVALDEKYRTSLTGLHEEEIWTLFVAHNQKPLDELNLGEAAGRTLLKLSAALPERHLESVNQIRQRILIDPSWWWADSHLPAFWEELQQAVYEDCCIEAVYERHSGEPVKRLLEPYSLVAKSSLWYLLAKRDGELRIYRVSRFQQIKMLETHFRRDKDFDLPTHWQTHLQTFVSNMAEYAFTLRIHPDRFHFVQWLMPGRYRIGETVENGWMTLYFQVQSIDLARMLVFGLGTQVEIIEPDELRQSILVTVSELCQSLSRGQQQMP